jgi:hypothetical protein
MKNTCLSLCDFLKYLDCGGSFVGKSFNLTDSRITKFEDENHLMRLSSFIGVNPRIVLFTLDLTLLFRRLIAGKLVVICDEIICVIKLFERLFVSPNMSRMM